MYEKTSGPAVQSSSQEAMSNHALTAAQNSFAEVLGQSLADLWAQQQRGEDDASTRSADPGRTPSEV